MKKSIWCFLDIHKWIYTKDRTVRKCKLCAKEQNLIDGGQEVSGMASLSFWETVK